MPRWASGKTKKNHLENEDIWRESNIDSTFCIQTRPRWYDHVLMNEGGHLQEVLNMQVQGKQKNGIGPRKDHMAIILNSFEKTIALIVETKTVETSKVNSIEQYELPGFNVIAFTRKRYLSMYVV